jgi:hypothetical protein
MSKGILVSEYRLEKQNEECDIMHMDIQQDEAVQRGTVEQAQEDEAGQYVLLVCQDPEEVCELKN